MKRLIKKLVKESFYELLLEEQTFDFDAQKELFMQWIDAARKNKEWYGETFNPFYHLITNGSNLKRNELNLFGFSQKNADDWEHFVRTTPFHSNGAWSQVDFNTQIQRKTDQNKNVTLNYYITIEKTRENIINFAKSINDLIKSLNELSNEKQSPISFKTHTYLQYVISHNDTLKVFFYDKDIKDDIKNIVQDWTKRNNIKLDSRTHDFGVDMKQSPNGGKESYGQILAGIVAEQFAKIIKKYGDKYTNEQYYEWLKKNMPDMIKNVKIKY